MKYAWPTIMHNAVFSVGHFEMTMGNLKSKCDISIKEQASSEQIEISVLLEVGWKGQEERDFHQRDWLIYQSELTLFGVSHFDSLFRHRARGNQCHVAQVAHSTHARVRRLPQLLTYLSLPV